MSDVAFPRLTSHNAPNETSDTEKTCQTFSFYQRCLTTLFTCPPILMAGRLTSFRTQRLVGNGETEFLTHGVPKRSLGTR